MGAVSDRDRSAPAADSPVGGASCADRSRPETAPTDSPPMRAAAAVSARRNHYRLNRHFPRPSRLPPPFHRKTENGKRKPFFPAMHPLRQHGWRLRLPPLFRPSPAFLRQPSTVNRQPSLLPVVNRLFFFISHPPIQPFGIRFQAHRGELFIHRGQGGDGLRITTWIHRPPRRGQQRRDLGGGWGRAFRFPFSVFRCPGRRFRVGGFGFRRGDSGFGASISAGVFGFRFSVFRNRC